MGSPSTVPVPCVGMAGEDGGGSGAGLDRLGDPDRDQGAAG